MSINDIYRSCPSCCLPDRVLAEQKGNKDLKNSWIFQSWWRIAISFLAVTLVLSLCLVHLLAVTITTRAARAHPHTGVKALKFPGHPFGFLQSATPPPANKHARQQLSAPR